MKAKYVVFGALLLGGAFSSMKAQRSVRLVLGGGMASPVGRFDSTYSARSTVLAGLAWEGFGNFVGGRIDYSANTFNGRTVGGTKYEGRTVPAVTANIVGTIPLRYTKPYLIVGGGWYPFREAADTKRENDFGVVGGAGITFPFFGAAGFLEGRYHSVSSRKTFNRFVPVTLGLVI